MKASKKTKRGVIGATVLAGVLAIGGFALTDVLVVPTTSHAGDGMKPIENVSATAVHYDLNAANPSKVDDVKFTLSKVIPTGGKVWIQPVSTTGATGGVGGSVKGFWYACTAPDGVITAYTCVTTTSATPAPATQLAADDIDQVRVVAAD